MSGVETRIYLTPVALEVRTDPVLSKRIGLDKLGTWFSPLGLSRKLLTTDDDPGRVGKRKIFPETVAGSGRVIHHKKVKPYLASPNTSVDYRETWSKTYPLKLVRSSVPLGGSGRLVDRDREKKEPRRKTSSKGTQTSGGRTTPTPAPTTTGPHSTDDTGGREGSTCRSGNTLRTPSSPVDTSRSRVSPAVPPTTPHSSSLFRKPFRHLSFLLCKD